MTAPKPMTLGRAVDAYLAPNGPLGTEGTRETYGKALRPMAAHFGPGTPLAELKPQDVAAWLSEQWGARSAGTFNVRLRAVKAAAAWWAKQDWIQPGLTAKAEPKKPRPEREVVVLTPAQVKAIMDQALGTRAPTGIRNKALIMFLYRSGLRIGEALTMRPGAVNHEDQSIRLLHTKAGDAQVRYYHPSAEGLLEKWLGVRAGLGFNGRQPVFCTISEGPRTRPGNHLSRQYVSQMLKESAKEAGIEERVHPHELRHTYAVELLKSGVDVATISKLLGHKSIASTVRYLASLTNAQAGAVLRSLDLPDVGEGEPAEPAGERDLAAEVDKLTKRLAKLEGNDPGARTKATSRLPIDNLDAALELAAGQRDAGLTREQCVHMAGGLRVKGATLEQIGMVFGVTASTIFNWLKHESEVTPDSA